MNAKRAALSELLDTNLAVLLQVDGRACDVPEHLRAESQLVLRVGYQLDPPAWIEIPDNFGIITTLTFRGTAYKVRVPWSALFCIVVEGDPFSLIMFPNAAPKEAFAPCPPEPPTRSHLRSIS